MLKNIKRITKDQEWIRDCESICFECSSKADLIVIHEGVALCRECFVDEYNELLEK